MAGKEMQFNPNLVNGVPANHEELARIIAQFVNADTTEPRLPENRDAWLSDYELRLLEKPVGYDAKHWEWYADVCKCAANLIENPSGRALLLLAWLNGERRILNPNWDWVKTIAKRAEELISSLDMGARKERLSSLLNYHRGIVARYIGDYERASEEQEKAIAKAAEAGDVVGVLISKLCRSVEDFNRALSDGDETTTELQILSRNAHRVVRTCTGNDPTQMSWRLSNAPVHVLQAHIWGLHSISSLEEAFWMNLLTVELPLADKNRFEEILPMITAIKSGLAYLKNNRIESLRLANEVETTMRNEARLEARMTARFIMALLAADEHLRVITEDGGYMHQLRRMARRILSGEVNQWCRVNKNVA